MPAQLPQPEESSHLNSLLARWQEAQSRCRENLRTSELRQALMFQTPEQLEADLRRLETKEADTIVQKLIVQLYPFLSTVQQFFVLLAVITPPVTIEKTLFLGLLHMIITGAIRSSATLGKLVKMLNKIKTELVFFQECAKSVRNNHELQNSIVDALVVLMEFWVKTEELFRQSPQERLITEGWPSLTSAFEEAMNRLNESVRNVHRHAFLERSGMDPANLEGQANNNKLFSVLTLNSDETNDFSCYSFPKELPYFYGRSTEIGKIAGHLEKNLEIDERRTFVIYGLGGSGKTSVARTYAQQCKENKTYDAILWVKSQTVEDMQDSFAEIGHALGLSAEDGNKDPILRVKNWLSKTKKTWLLIYDNVEDVLPAKALPSDGRGRLLITTRYKWIAYRSGGQRGLIHELETFNENESLEMFEGLCEMYEPGRDRKDERPQIRKLLLELDGLALGIEQIAAYISYRQETIESFLQQYERAAKRIYTNTQGSPAEQSLATVWEVQFEKIRGTNAATVLGILSLLAPDSIPINLFIPDPNEEEWDDEISDIIGYNETEMEQIFDTLMRVALIKRASGSVSVHRLIQNSFLQMNFYDKFEKVQGFFDTACQLLNYRYPKSDTGYSHMGKWEACARYLPHVTSMAHLYEKHTRLKAKLTASTEFMRMVRNCAWFQYECSNHRACLDLLEIGMHGCADKSGLEYAHFCSHAACALYELHEVPRGREFMEVAVQTRVRLLGPDDGQLANAFSNKALLELSDCNYKEALRLFEDALKIRKRINNYYIASNHALLGLTYVFMGDSSQAERELDECVRICKEGGTKMDYVYSMWGYQEPPKRQNKLTLYSERFFRGNLALKRGDIQEAKNIFMEGRSVIAKLSPTSVKVSAFEYKLGYVELKLNNIQSAIDHLNTSITITKYQEIEGELGRAYRLKAIALRKKQILNEAEQIELDYAETISKDMLRKYFKGREAEKESLTEEEQYDMLLCGQRR